MNGVTKVVSPAPKCILDAHYDLDAADIISISGLWIEPRPKRTQSRSKWSVKVQAVVELPAPHFEEHLQETYVDGNCRVGMQPALIPTAANPEINSTGQNFEDAHMAPKHVPFIQQPGLVPTTQPSQPPVLYFDAHCKAPLSDQCYGISELNQKGGEMAVYTAATPTISRAEQDFQLLTDLDSSLSQQANATIPWQEERNNNFAPQLAHVIQSGQPLAPSFDMKYQPAQIASATTNHTGASFDMPTVTPLVYADQHPMMLVSPDYEFRFDTYAVPVLGTQSASSPQHW